MFNTLVYIPTILAYTFITLLVVILGFIVIYVTHKIYTTLYDNLPVAQLSTKYSLTEKYETMAPLSSLFSMDSKTVDNQEAAARKSKTALRIIVNLEPCFLAYMVFESLLTQSGTYTPYLHKISHNSSASGNSSIAHSQDSMALNNHLLMKYFDTLAAIPTTRDLQKCDHFKLYK